MREKSKKKELKWHESGNIITSLIVGVIALIIICSQSFAVSGDSSLALFGSIINHNSIYLLVVIYFIFLKLRVGKKYFNYLNVFLIFIYLLVTVTSLLTLVQSFSLNTTLTFILNFVFLIYLFHTMFRDTRIWRDFNLGDSPFNELSNEWYFYALIVISLILLAVNLISTAVIGGVVISILDTIYIVLFGRYIFLYRDYLDYKNKDANNKGNFDEIKENIKKAVDDVTDKVLDSTNDLKDKVNDYMEKNEIDDKIKEVKEKAAEKSNDLKDKVNNYIEKNEIDDKIKEIKDKVAKSSNDLKDKVSDLIDDVDDKVVNVKKSIDKEFKEIKKKDTTKRYDAESSIENDVLKKDKSQKRRHKNSTDKRNLENAAKNKKKEANTEKGEKR